MKNNKIPQSGQFQNPIEKQQIPHCQASSNIHEKQQNTTLSGQFQ
jgi:hypothetical protein